MRRNEIIVALAVTVPWVAVPSHLTGQAPTLDEICGSSSTLDLADLTLAADDPRRRLFPDSARTRLGPLVDGGDWPMAVDSLAAWFRATRTPDPAATAMLVRLDSLRTLFEVLGGTTTVDEASDWSRLDFDHLLDFDVTLDVMAGRYTIFEDEPVEIAVDATDSAATQMALCWTAISAEDLIGRHQRPDLESVRDRIRHSLRLWETYNEAGRSQYPWELWLNGFRDDPLQLEPRRWQAIALHPWIGFQLRGIDRASLNELGPITRTTVVPFDLLGILFYRDDFTRYWGVSALLTFGEDRTRGGLALHLSNGVSLGPTFSEAGTPDAFLITLDFYKLLAGLPQQQAAVVDQLRDALAAGGSP